MERKKDTDIARSLAIEMGTRVHSFVQSDSRLAWTFTPAGKRLAPRVRDIDIPLWTSARLPGDISGAVFFKDQLPHLVKKTTCPRDARRDPIARTDAPRSSCGHFAILRVERRDAGKRFLTWRTGMIPPYVDSIGTNAFVYFAQQLDTNRCSSASAKFEILIKIAQDVTIVAVHSD